MNENNFIAYDDKIVMKLKGETKEICVLYSEEKKNNHR